LGSNLFHGLNTLKVTVTGSNSGTTSLNYDSINAITLALRESKEFNPLAYAVDNDLVFNFIPVGEVKKTLKVYLNNALNNSKDFNSTISNSQEAINVFAPIDKETEEVIHGVYSMKAVLSYSTGVGEIKTDPLTYEVAFVNSKETAPLIWFNKYPTTIVDHDRLSLQFMVYDPVNPLHTNVERFVNNTAISPLEDIAYSDTEWFTWNISNYKLGKNTFSLKCGSTTAEVVIYVEEDTIRDLEIVDNANLWLNLTTLDRSNKENKTSRERWEYHHKNNTTTSVQFNNFNWYNNGWIDDKESGNSILRISNGASIDIPLRVMNSEDLETSLTFEIRFKLRNVQKYSNLITVSSEVIGKNEYDEDIVKVTKNVSSTEGVWCKYNKNNIGMCLGTQEGFFKGSSAIASGRYKED
jgi:hypothetical protein